MSPPGPRTTTPFGHLLAFRSDPLGFLTRVAEVHGDVAAFRLGPYRTWLLTHPDLVHEVLATHAGRFRKSPVLQRARIVLGDGLLTAEGDHHRRRRRLLQPAFHPQHVRSYASVMVDRAATTADAWVPGEPTDVHADTVRMTLMTAGTTLLGTDVAEEVDVVEHAIDDLLSAYRLAFVPFGSRLTNLPIGPARRLRRGRRNLHDLVDRMIRDRRRHGEDGGDLLSSLVLTDEPDRPSDQEIRDEALTLLLAGHETTANALAFSLCLLAQDPGIEAEVHREIDAVLDGREATADDRDRLPVCRGVFAEALRLYPPSWGIAREVVEEHVAGEHEVPAGDLVMVPPWVVHRDPRWWPEPTRFDPDRWVRDAGSGRERSAFVPFGGGVRRCIGEGFAWTEGVLALATIVRRWHLRPVPERPTVLDPAITLRPRDGVWLRPEHRRP